MTELNQILNVLDNLPNNSERNKYLESIRKNPNIGRHDLVRISCNILIQSNFVENYYRISFTKFLKLEVQKIIKFFRKFSFK